MKQNNFLFNNYIMNKKYKLVKLSNDNNNQKGGTIPPIQMPTFPIMNPFSGQIQVASPVLPTVDPTFNVYPRPLTLGPKINIFPQAKTLYQPVYDNSCLPKPKLIIPNNCPTKKCDISLLDYLTNSKQSNIDIFSPLSDGLPSLDFFN